MSENVNGGKPVANSSLRPFAYLCFVFLVALVPRLAGLSAFVAGDEPNWADRSALFLAALQEGRWFDTAQTAHPGVTTMWSGAFGLLLTGWDFSQAANPATLAAMRLPVALLSALGVASLYGLGRLLVGEKAALLGALLAAFDPFYLAHSRILHHDALATTFATVSVLSLAVYWRNDDGNGERGAFWPALSGVMAGLAFLSKASALFLLPFGCGALLIAGRKRTLKLKMKSLAVFGGAMALAVGLAWPAMWVRPLDALRLTLGGSLELAEAGHRQYFLGRVVSDPGFGFYPLVFLFRATPPVLLGLVGALFAWRRERRCQAPGWGAGVLAVYALLFAVFISLGAKKFDRYLLAVFPTLDLLAGWGLYGLFEAAARRSTRGRLGRWFAVGCVLAQVGLSLPHHPYYLSYYNPAIGGAHLARQALLVGWGEGLDEAGRYLNENDGGLVAASWFSRQLAAFFRGRVVGLAEEGAALKADYTVFYLNQLQRGYPGEELLEYFGLRRPEYVVRAKGIDYAWLYRGPIYGFGPGPAAGYQSGGVFGGQVELSGYDLEPAACGQKLPLTLYWRCLADLGEDYHVYLRLVDEQGRIWARQDRWPVLGLWRTLNWRAGMFVTDEYALLIPPGTPPGEYQLEVGLYALQTANGSGRVLEVSALHGGARPGFGGGLTPGMVTVTKPPAPPTLGELSMQRRSESSLNAEIELLGYDFEGGSASSGQRLPLTLYWRASREVKGDYLLALWLEDEEGQSWGDRQERPTLPGQKGEIGRDVRDFLVSGGVPGGVYRLMLALADGRTGERSEPVALGRVEVRSRERLYEAPAMPHPLKVNLGNLVELLGYDLEVQPAGTLQLTLYWRALSEMETAYTVFVHLLDEDGQIQAQQDGPPPLPTTGWAVGEVVVDGREVMAPAAGRYTLAVGLYDVFSGERLPVLGEAQDDRIILGEVEIGD